MRIGSQFSRQQRLAEIRAGEARLDEARARVSSGLRVRKPSDAPGEMAELLETRSRVEEFRRRRESLNVALPLMKATESTLGEITNGLRQARNLAIQANSGATSPQQRQTLADQVERLAERTLSLANTQSQGHHIFAGTESDRAPFTGQPAAYSGGSTPMQVGLAAGESFAVSVPGSRLLNARPDAAGGETDLFRNLSRLAQAIRAGNPAGIAEGSAGLDADLDNVLRLRGDMGARLQYVEFVRDRMGEDLTAAQERRSQLQDADLAEAILEMKSAESAQEATLATAARMEKPSLLDYLR